MRKGREKGCVGLVALSALLLIIVECGVQYVAASSSGPKICYRTECVRESRRSCVYSTWLGCCLYKTVYVTIDRRVKYCCDGWSDNGNGRCDQAVCRPTCKNGGTCSSPGVCQCMPGYTGNDCDQAECSYRDPCYPGECMSRSTDCTCSSGFSNLGWDNQKRCLRLSGRPEVFDMKAKLRYIGVMDGKDMEMYSLLSDSSGKYGDDMDFLWTNREKFNQLEIEASSQYNPQNLPPRPAYVRNSGFGIVAGDVRILHTKRSFSSNRRKRSEIRPSHVSQNETIACDRKLSAEQPNTALFNCRLNPRFDRSLENEDRLTIFFTTKSGGYRRLDRVGLQYFEGQEVTSQVEFRFDLQPPYHCSRDLNCDEQLLSVAEFTKEPVQVEWGGWTDDLSGMNRYALELFSLNRTVSDTLQILQPLKPLRIEAVNHTESGFHQMTFTPPGPGMYALILEASDRANNSAYSRRLTLYDPVSKVSTDPQHKLHFSSASPANDFSFQNNTQNPIELNWERVFRNAIHEEGAFLASVEGYGQHLEHGRKHVAFEDNEGERTVRAIPNTRGIVKFQVAYVKQGKVGRDELKSPPSHVTWTDVGLDQTYTIPEDVDNGDIIIAWVRASDVMGNEAMERAVVSFDTTPAAVEKLEFHMNRKVPGIDFSSMFSLAAKDMESGIAEVRWTFTRSNGSVIYRETVPGKRVQSCASSDFRTCYCTPRDECYQIDQPFSLSNCRMMVEKESLDREILFVTARVVNSAGIVTSETMEKGQLTMLNGTAAYYPPQNVRMISQSQSSVAVTWDFPPSCYERTELWIAVPGPSGQEEKRKIHKDAKRFDLLDLVPDKDYKIELFATYTDGIMSAPAVFNFRLHDGELSAGAVAGISIGVVLLILVLVMVVLALLVRRSGYQQLLPGRQIQRLRNSLSSRGSSRRNDNQATSTNPENPTYNSLGKVEDDDLYLAADQTWNTRQPWLVDADQLALEDQIASGNFADIYSATLRNKEGKEFKVAAKMLKSGFDSNAANVMIAKIHFFANEVGTHANVLHFHGAVMDNEHLGPVMVLEYCETGRLDKWLQEQKRTAGEELMQRLCRISKDIACGMDYLASKGIVHSRLAARNVLLTFLLEVKIAGLGPIDDKEGKVAAKWAAPEILENNPATEKSDVWSYGVTLWEVFSLGAAPYPGVRGTEMGPYLKGGNRMDRPEFADDTFYSLMQSCWKAKPSSRPTFSTIKKQLCALFTPAARSSGDFYYATDQLLKS